MSENLPTIAEDEDGLIEMLPKFLQDAAKNVLVEISDHELEKALFQGGTPDLLCMRLRIAFWDEFEEACRKNHKKMNITKVIGGICNLTQFRRFIKDRHRLTWLLRMPADYRLALADIHQLSLAQMREIMTMDNYDDKGQPNVKLLDVKVKLSQHVDMRLKGAIIQRIDQRNLNVNVDAESQQKPEPLPMSMDEIDRRIAGLKQKSSSLLVPGGMQVDLLSGITAEGDTIEVHVQPLKNSEGG